MVHTEIDFLAPVRWRDAVRVAAECERDRVDELHPRVRRVPSVTELTQEQIAVHGRNVYVVVSTQDWAKRALPEHLRRGAGIRCGSRLNLRLVWR